MAMEERLRLVAKRPLRTKWGAWEEHLYISSSNTELTALIMGDVGALEYPILCRVHSFCYSAHALLSAECECLEQMQEAQRQIAEIGRGVLVVLDQDGRAFGHGASMEASSLVAKGMTLDEAYVHLKGTPDARQYDDAAEVLVRLGIKRVRLLTDNPEKIASLNVLGLGVEQCSMKTAEEHHDPNR